jgi:hypothetical protein
MKVLLLLVADHASVESNTGKLNILGAFRTIMASQFPVRHHAMSLVVKLGGEMGDKPNPHSLSASFTDDDGRELLKVSGSFNMPHGEPGIQPEFNAVMEFREMVFSRPGTYRFYIRVDDAQLIESTAIQVVQFDQAPE